MTRTEDGKALYAGTNEVYRYGRKAQEKVSAFLEPNKNGWISIPANGGKYWAFGTSDGKYGEYIRVNDQFFSVNKGGYAYAKAGTEKGDALQKVISGLLATMKSLNEARVSHDDDEE